MTGRLTGDWTMRSKVILIALAASSLAACNTTGDMPDKGVAAVNVHVVTPADDVFVATAPERPPAAGRSVARRARPAPPRRG